jgi:succinate-acetate transporter protein
MDVRESVGEHAEMSYGFFWNILGAIGMPTRIRCPNRQRFQKASNERRA